MSKEINKSKKHDSLFTSTSQTKTESLEDQPYEYTNEEKKS